MTECIITTEEILRTINEKWPDALREQERLLALFADLSKGRLKAQYIQLRTFLECDGNICILNLRNKPEQKQRVEYTHLIQRMINDYSMREDTAVEICNTFWRVALETAPPEYTLRRNSPAPAPESTPEPQPEQITETPREEKLPPIPDPPIPDQKPKPQRFRFKHFAGLALLVVLVLAVVSLLNDSTGKRTRSDLEPFQLEKSIEDMLLAGTEEIYTYPDGTRMEFYYDDAGKEIYRVYVNTENEIENLFEARYDSAGRLVYHQIFDGQGNLLRADSYDFHSSEDTAQRRVTLGDGRSFQGQSTFDENGYETFTLNHADGTKTVYVYEDGGVLTRRANYDAEGNAPEVTSDAMQIGFDLENAPKVYGPRQTVMGWTNGNSYTTSYVQGICGGALKEYSVNDAASEEDQAAFLDIYDPMGNLLEEWYYQDGQLNDLFSYEVHSYDQQGNYNGYTSTYYYGDGDYCIEQYDADGIRKSQEIHRFEGEEEVVLYSRYETELDDQGQEVCVREFDGETGRLESIEEYEYDSQGNRQKRIRTAYDEDGGYSIFVEDGEGKDLSRVTYYPSGNIRWQTEYSKDGIQSKRTTYYENGQIEDLHEYNAAGEMVKNTWYYASGQTERIIKYNDAGDTISEIGYYENGQIDFQHEYNDAGQKTRYTGYYETGSKKYVTEYNDQGEIVKEIYYNEDGTVYK